MVGYSRKEKSLSYSKYAVAGAASGVLTRLVTQPLEVLKIRFQVGMHYRRSVVACTSLCLIANEPL